MSEIEKYVNNAMATWCREHAYNSDDAGRDFLKHRQQCVKFARKHPLIIETVNKQKGI